MTHPLICAATICFLLSFCVTTKAQETVDSTIKLRNQFNADIFILKEGVEFLQSEIEVLNKKSNTQIEMLKAMPSQSGEDNRFCRQIDNLFKAAYSKYNLFEDNVVTKLSEIQEEQTTNFNKILVKQNLSINCQQGSARMSEALAQINGKIDKIETHLHSLKTLEEKLKQQQNNFQSVNGEQMKMLREINAKMSQYQEKYEKFEQRLPNLLKAAMVVPKMPAGKKHTLPVDVINGLETNQTAQKG